MCALWYALNVNLKLCRVFSDRYYWEMQTVCQDLILMHNQNQVPAGAQQRLHLPNNVGVRQYVVATENNLLMHQQVVLGGQLDAPTFVQQNVVRLEAPAHHMRWERANNNDHDHNRRQGQGAIPVPIAVHNDDMREEIPVRVNANAPRLPSPA